MTIHMKTLNSVVLRCKEQFSGLRDMHPGLWPLLPRLLCALLVVVAVTACGWIFYVEGQMHDVERALAQEMQLRQLYQRKVQQAVNLEGLRHQKIQLTQHVARLEEQLPGKAEMDALLSDINKAGVQRSLQFQLFKPGQAVTRDYYAELPINLKLVGRYHDIGGFASDIANLSRIVTLHDLNLLADKSGVLTLEAVARTFRYLDTEEIEALHKTMGRKERISGKGGGAQ